MRALLYILALVLIAGRLSSQENDPTIQISNLTELNTEQTEFSPLLWNDFLVYVKARGPQSLLDKKTKEPFFDLMISEKLPEGYSRARSFSSVINTPYHEGPASLSDNGDRILFSRVDYDGNEFNVGKDKTVTLKIFEAYYEEGTWTKAFKSSINEKNIASCHPSLSADEQILVFASDREGGYGKMDLYMSRHTYEGWTAPENLGPEINSAGNDWFPYLDENNYLFYSSDGKTETSGLDLHISLMDEGRFLPALLLPAPLNSGFDDFGLSCGKKATLGYISSNRPGGKGKDDLYTFHSDRPLYHHFDSTYNLIKINVKGENGLSISGAEVSQVKLHEEDLSNFNKDIFEIDSHPSQNKIYTQENGNVSLRLSDGYNLITVSYPGKESWQQILSEKGKEPFYDIVLTDTLTLKAPEPEIIYVEKEVRVSEPTLNNVEVKVGAIIVLENIYYDYNSYDLTRGAKTELDKLVMILKENPRLKIQLSAHTDSRGRSEYNMDLSQKRASSAKSYLVSQGVAGSQISSVGYGESQLRNHCADGVNCSEAEHIYNRRTEVKVLEN